MNCRFTPIDARIFSVSVGLAQVGAQVGMALQHSPGEGPGGSS